MQGTVSLSHPNTTFWGNMSTEAHLQTAREPHANQMYRKKSVAACISWQVTYICRMYCRAAHGGAVCLTLRLGTILRSIGKKESSTHDDSMSIVSGLIVDTIRLRLNAFIICAPAKSVALRRLQFVFYYQPNRHHS
jgi:hypothetical protein